MEKILIKEMLSAYSNLSRQIEFLNVKMFGLTQLLLNKGIIGVDEANQEKIRYYREQYLYMKSYVKSTAVEVRAKYLMEVLKANVNH